MWNKVVGPVVDGAVKAGRRLGSHIHKRWAAPGAAAAAKGFKNASDFMQSLAKKIKNTNLTREQMEAAAKRVSVKAAGRGNSALKQALIRQVQKNKMIAALVAYELYGPTSEFVAWAYENIEGADERLEQVEEEKRQDGISEIEDHEEVEDPVEEHFDVISGMERKMEVFTVVDRVAARLGGVEAMKDLKYVFSLPLETLDEYIELKTLRGFLR